MVPQQPSGKAASFARRGNRDGEDFGFAGGDTRHDEAGESAGQGSRDAR